MLCNKIECISLEKILKLISIAQVSFVNKSTDLDFHYSIDIISVSIFVEASYKKLAKKMPGFSSILENKFINS